MAAIALCLVAGAAAEGKPRKLEGDEVEAQHSGTYTYNGKLSWQRLCSCVQLSFCSRNSNETQHL